MTGSPNSSGSPMMLRSQCRAELVPNHYYLSYYSIWFTLLICLATHYLIYVQYILPMTIQMDETVKLSEQMRRKYEHCLSKREVVELVDTKISLYDADKTNQADYALESGGATIVTTRCTKSYLERNIQYSIDGLLPVFFTSNSPRVVIQPSVTPGECWSFAGSEGVLVVQLSRTIIPTAITYEHIRREISPDLHIESAPKHFRVKSLRDANDKDGLLLGEYEFDKNGRSLQQFSVQNPNPLPTRFIELIIQSNHGELQYTCLYRFRVHGIKY